MDKKIFIIIGVIVALFGGLWAYSSNVKTTTPTNYGRFTRDKIEALSKNIDFNNYDLYSVVAADENTGGLSENVEGDPEKAKVVIFEYADYECSHCAEWNPKVNKMLEKYGDKVAVVYRDYLLTYNDNATVAASAAEAAAIQGYWQGYKDHLFSNQNIWYSLKTDKAAEKFEEYFETVTDGKGDVQKFHEDMRSEAVAKKLAFDLGAGDAIELEGTPAFYINGEKVTVSELEDTVKKLVKE